MAVDQAHLQCQLLWYQFCVRLSFEPLDVCSMVGCRWCLCDAINNPLQHQQLGVLVGTLLLWDFGAQGQIPMSNSILLWARGTCLWGARIHEAYQGAHVLQVEGGGLCEQLLYCASHFGE
jgi:hypothetical protein